MNTLARLHDAVFDRLERLAPALLPTLARVIFAAILLVYYWTSAATKLGDGVFGFIRLDPGAFVQMFPRQMEAAGYDPSALGAAYHVTAIAGTWAEFVLPALIVIGLLTRLAALGMIGFVLVQSLTDILGHGADPATIGRWFDAASGAHIADQRSLWLFVLLVLVFRGAGPLSLDRLLSTRRGGVPAQAMSG